MTQHKLSLIAGGNPKWYRHDPVTVLLGIYPVYLKSYVHTPKKHHVNVCGSFIHNYKKLEVILIDEWIDKLVNPNTE